MNEMLEKLGQNAKDVRRQSFEIFPQMTKIKP